MSRSEEHARTIQDLMRHITKGFKQYIVDQLHEFGLTLPQLSVLRALSEEGPLSLAELSKKVDLTSSTVSGIVDRLVRMDLVERRRDEVDRRVVWMSVTAAWLEMKETIPGYGGVYLTGLLDKLSAQEQTKVIDALQILKRVIE